MRYLHWVVLLGLLISACSEDSTTDIPDELPGNTIKHYNPIIKDQFTADPAALVYQDTVFVYTGHDEQEINGEGYLMNEWLVFSSTDLQNWTPRGAALAVSDFSWAARDAWAGHCVEANGRFYWYICAEHKDVPGKAIGVAVSDYPTGPFTDALGHALVTNDMTTAINSFWDDIDPAVYVDDDGQAYIYWGNTVCYYAKLKPNMIELDGDIHVVEGVPNFTEAPHIHKYNGQYYLTYAAGWPEATHYSVSDHITGPWEYKGQFNAVVENSPTNHQTIIDYEGQSYFIYHNGSLNTGGEYRRSVCIDSMFYDADGTIRPIIQTRTGVKSIR